MNILFLAESLNPRTGWGTYARDLVSALRRTDARVTVLTAYGRSDGIHLPGPHAPWVVWRLAEFRLRRWLRTRQADVVHVTAEVYAQMFRAWGKTPFVVTVHGTYADPDAYPPYAERTRKAFRAARQLIAVSERTRERVPSEFHNKTVVIPNGVDLSIRDEPFDAVPSHGSPLVLSVGAIKPRKGFDRLIAGFAVFLRTHPNAELVIVGRSDRPDTRDTLVRRAHDLGIGNRVRFTGEVSRAALLGWLRACDVFALTPIEEGGIEGFGLVYLEAQAFGKPCIGARGSAAAEVVREGETGFLVSPDDPSQLADALSRVLSFDASRIRQSLSGRTWDDRAGEYSRMYAHYR